MYRTVNRDNDIVISLYGDMWLPDLLFWSIFVIYINVKSPRSTFDINITLFVNYASFKKQFSVLC